jgi:hypothetical protein
MDQLTIGCWPPLLNRLAPFLPRTPSGEKSIQLCLFVRVELVPAVLDALDVEPDAQDPFLLCVNFLVAWPVVAPSPTPPEPSHSRSSRNPWDTRRLNE